MVDFDRTYWMVEVTRGTVVHEPYVERVFHHEAMIHADKAKELGYAHIRVITQSQYEQEKRTRRTEQHEKRIAKSEAAAAGGKANKDRPHRHAS